MKIKQLKFENHKVLGDLEIDFTDEKTGDPLDTIVFIGDNGTGKTQILKAIVENAFDEYAYISKNYDNDFKISGRRTWGESGGLRGLEIIISGGEDYFYSVTYEIKDLGECLKLKLRQPAIIWMPAELNIEKDVVREYLEPKDRSIREISHIESANKWTLDDVRDYIVDMIDEILFSDIDKTSRQAIEEIIKMTNDIFKILNLDIELANVSWNKEKTVHFKNKQGNSLDINNLSSGEKQLFFRMLNLKRLNVNNAIILIDEPETSLHPDWQRKIIDVYRNIGENNQIIMATHSPLIIGSAPTESIRIMSRNDEGKIEVHQQDIYDKSHGKTADYILKVTMDLDTPRDEETQKNIDLADELLQNDKYETEQYKKLMQSLIEQLGSDDQDVLRLQMAQAVRMRKNAESK